jgi:hypothetical protein
MGVGVVSVFRTVTFPGKMVVEVVLSGEWFIGGACDEFRAIRGADGKLLDPDRVLVLSNYSVVGIV